MEDAHSFPTTRVGVFCVNSIKTNDIMMSEETDSCMLEHICDMFEKYFSIVSMYRDMLKTLPEMPSNDKIQPKIEKLLEIAKTEEKSLTEEFKKQYESLFEFYKKCNDSTYVLEKAIFNFKMETDTLFEDVQN